MSGSERNEARVERKREASESTPFYAVLLPPAINNALAYKSASYTCVVDQPRVRGSYVSVHFACPAMSPSPSREPALSLSLNTLSLARSEFPAFALAAG